MRRTRILIVLVIWSMFIVLLMVRHSLGRQGVEIVPTADVRETETLHRALRDNRPLPPYPPASPGFGASFPLSAFVLEFKTQVQTRA